MYFFHKNISLCKYIDKNYAMNTAYYSLPGDKIGQPYHRHYIQHVLLAIYSQVKLNFLRNSILQVKNITCSHTVPQKSLLSENINN